MLKVGIIGAGAISERHIEGYVKHPDAQVCSICDLNENIAKIRAQKYSIPKYCSDYKDILNDENINAVSIVTPTFTHKNIIIEALEAGKSVLCEKPPALNADEVKECQECAKKYNGFLMFGFVCRFRDHVQYLKDYIDSGKMGKVFCAEAVRVHRLIESQGWFGEKAKGGGALIDSAIHEVDEVLYLMGYPKVKSVLAFATDANTHLPAKMKSGVRAWETGNNVSENKDIENFISGYVTLENGASIYIKTSNVLHTATPGCYIEICGERAGAKMDLTNKEKPIIMVDELDGYMRETSPIIIEKIPMATKQINHFVDCCLNGTECICKVDEAVALMEVIDAMYESAATGKVVVVNE